MFKDKFSSSLLDVAGKQLNLGFNRNLKANWSKKEPLNETVSVD